MNALAFEIAVKSPAPAGLKSPAQLRLESRAAEPKSPMSPDQLQSTLQAAEEKRKGLLLARAQNAGGQYEKAKELSAKQVEVITEIKKQVAEDIEKRLESAEKNRIAATEKALEKTKGKNQRVAEIQKKKEQMDAIEKENYDKATGERLASAEERRAQLIEESKSKASAEITKAKELLAKKQQTVAEMDEKISLKQKAAEERRVALLNEQKEKAAAAVLHAKDVAAQQQQKEILQREELRQEIDTRMAEAENRRLSGGHSPSRLSLRSPGQSTGASGMAICSPVPAPQLE